MSSIEAALDFLIGVEKPNYAETARLFKCDRTTLSRRHRGVCVSKTELHEWQSLLSHQQELELVDYINELVRRGSPPTNVMVKRFAAQIAKKEPGKCWVSRFIKRHSERLKSGYLEGTDAAR